MVGTSNIKVGIMDFDILEQRLLWLQRKIDILQSKIDGATLEDELSGHHRTVKFDKSSRMQTKYIEVNDIKPAAIILTQCVLQFLQPGPVSEKDLRVSSIARCKDLGVKFTGKGGIAGGSMDVFTVCNVLQSLGALEEIILPPSSSSSLATTTAHDLESALVVDGSVKVEGGDDANIEDVTTPTKATFVPSRSIDSSDSSSTTSLAKAEESHRRVDESHAVMRDMAVVERLLALRWEKHLKAYFRSSRKRKLPNISSACSSAAATATSAAALRIIAGNDAVEHSLSNQDQRDIQQPHRKRSYTIAGSIPVSVGSIHCSDMMESGAMGDVLGGGQEGTDIRRSMSFDQCLPPPSPNTVAAMKRAPAARRFTGSTRGGWVCRGHRPTNCMSSPLHVQTEKHDRETSARADDVFSLSMSDSSVSRGVPSTSVWESVTSSRETDVCGAPVPSVDFTNPMAIFSHPKEVLGEWARVCYLEGLQQEREECMLRYLAGQCGLSLPAEPFRIGTHFLQPDYTLDVKKKKFSFSSMSSSSVIAPAEVTSSQSVVDGVSDSVEGVFPINPTASSVSDGDVVGVVPTDPPPKTRTRGRPKGAHVNGSSMDEEGLVYGKPSRVNSTRGVTESGNSDIPDKSPNDCHTSSTPVEERVGEVNGKIYTAAELIQRAQLMRRSQSTHRRLSNGSGKRRHKTPLTDSSERVFTFPPLQHTTSSSGGVGSGKRRAKPSSTPSSSYMGGGVSGEGSTSVKPYVPPMELTPSVFASTYVTTTDNPAADTGISDLSSHDSNAHEKSLVAYNNLQQQSLPDLTIFSVPVPWLSIAQEFTLFHADEAVDTPVPPAPILSTVGSATATAPTGGTPSMGGHNRGSYPSPRDRGSYSQSTSTAAVIPESDWQFYSPRPGTTTAGTSGEISKSGGSGKLRITVPQPTPPSSTHSASSWDFNITPSGVSHASAVGSVVAVTSNYNGAMGIWVPTVECVAEPGSDGNVPTSPRIEGRASSGVISTVSTPLASGIKGHRRKIQRVNSSGSDVETGSMEFRRVAFADVLAPSFREVPGYGVEVSDELSGEAEEDSEEEDISDEAVAARHEVTLSRMRSRMALIKNLKSSLKSGSGRSGSFSSAVGSSPRVGGGGILQSPSDEEQALHESLMATAATILNGSRTGNCSNRSGASATVSSPGGKLESENVHSSGSGVCGLMKATGVKRKGVAELNVVETHVGEDIEDSGSGGDPCSDSSLAIKESKSRNGDGSSSGAPEVTGSLSKRRGRPPKHSLPPSNATVVGAGRFISRRALQSVVEEES